MKISNGPPQHLTYCLNVHPGETWDENFNAIRTKTIDIRNRVSPKGPFGLGLRLGHEAALGLWHQRALDEFKGFLETENLYVFTVNGFPYGDFHGGPLKKRVYAPDWRSAKRLEYTLLLANILAELLPEGLCGSISTVPGSYGEWIETDGDQVKMVQNLMAAVLHLDRISKMKGKEIHLGLEPEPDCFLETTKGTIGFFSGTVFEEGKRYLSELGSVSPKEADAMIHRRLGVCFDTCHMSLQFEDLKKSVSDLVAHGIRISKIQLSAALKMPLLEESLKRVREFSDPVYLHQVKARFSGGGIQSYQDLPMALSSKDWETRACDQWRIHFHVPLYFKGDDILGSTQNDLDKGFFHAAALSGCEHLEIETYTFDVLPKSLKTEGVVKSVAREYEWVLGKMKNTESRSQNRMVGASMRF